MKKKKIFIEIAIPEGIKRSLMKKTAKWENLPVKWMKKENLHITLSFIGYVDESVIPDICRRVGDSVKNIESFEINFDGIELGPDRENPKIIWANGKESLELGKLNEAVEKALNMYPQKHKEYRPHITLGRIRKLKWDEMAKKPIIDEKINIAMTVENVLIMESKGGTEEYVVLEECVLF